VPAESLFEAAAEAMAAFKQSVLAEMPLAPGTRLTIRVKAPEEEHTVTVSKVLSWLDGVANQSEREAKEQSIAGTAEEMISAKALRPMTRPRRLVVGRPHREDEVPMR